MPKRKDGESKTGKKKKKNAERTDFQSNLFPEEEESVIESTMELFNESMHRENAERPSRKRKLSDQSIEVLVASAKAPRLTEQISSAMGTTSTLLYCRSGIIPQAEVSQQPSVQSERTTGDISALPLGQQLYELLIQHFDEETTGKLVSYLLDDEKLGIWFYDVVDIIGINEEHRTACRQEAIMLEIVLTFLDTHTVYSIGSSIEGTFALGEEHDGDAIQCDEGYPVFEKIEGPASYGILFLIKRELTSPAGYVKLQLVLNDMQCTSSYIPTMLAEKNFIDQYCKIDKCGRLVLHKIINMPYDPHFMCMTENKPALKVKNFYGISIDHNRAYQCTKWPTFAHEWISRDRLFGWPTNSMVHQMSSLGFFVVKKGHPLSPEKDLEWRASFSLQERKLMFSLTDVQHKCYTVLKMFNREIIKSNCITSYHWKTCLFYMIEQNSSIFWKKEQLFVCINTCMLLMLTWVKSEFCPNYFIPEDNLFAGKLDESQKFELESKLKELLKDGYNCLLNVKAGNICDYYRTRESLKHFQRLQSYSKHNLQKALYTMRRAQITAPLDHFNYRILEKCYNESNENVLLFIQNLWDILNRIMNTDTITKHTTEETKNALSSLLPQIYTCLASNIAAIAIQNTNSKVRDFLLFGSFTYFKKGNISGRLKSLSVLYAIGFYEDCKWHIDQLDRDIKKAPSICGCRLVGTELADNKNIITQFNVATCVSFLSSELPITPDALKYEMFKYFGIYVTEKERAHISFLWNYRAVVDCKVYFVFLKFLIQKELRRFEECNVYEELYLLLSRKQVTHCDVALNLMAWIQTSNLFTPATLHCLTLSWNFTNSVDICLPRKEMKQKLRQFNAAKLHALVALYKTWFARNAYSVKFCFDCYSFRKKFERCSNCKIARYCSIKCQTNNWKIHKAVCKIVKTYHNL